MKKPTIFSAVDIGTSKIATVIATSSPEDKSLRVVGVASVKSKGLRKSQVVDIEEVIEAATESVEMAERMAGFSIKSASVSVSGVHIESLNSKGLVAVARPDTEIERADVVRVVEAARAVPLPDSREIIHVVPRNFLVDNQEGIKDPVGMSGVRLEAEAHIITGSSVNIKNLTRVMSEIGLDTVGMTFAALASSEAVLTETEKELGVVLVDIGGGTTSLEVYVEGALTHSAVIPVGAKNITSDIAIGLRVSLDMAEVIKHNLAPEGHSKVLDPKNVTAKKQADEIDLHKLGIENAPTKISRKAVVEGIVRPRLNEIFELVKSELIKGGVVGKTPSGLVLTGGGALTYMLADAARRTLGFQSRIATPHGLVGLVDEINTPEYATVVGLLKLASRELSESTSPSPLRLPRLRLPAFKNFRFSQIQEFIKSFLP